MKYANLLKKVAKKSKHPTSYHAVIILQHGKPSAIGTNGAGRHAEAVALKRMRRGATGATLLSVRLRRDGRWGMARPCYKCYPLMVSAGIKAIYYTDSQGELIYEEI